MKRKTEKQKIGRKGERIAARYLRRQGCRILARNKNFGRNELDLVVKQGRYIAFVEVKTRSFDSPEQADVRPCAAVDKQKRLRTVQAARDYMHEKPTALCPRFDVVEVYLNRSKRHKPFKINHIPAAFLFDGTIH